VDLIKTIGDKVTMLLSCMHRTEPLSISTSMFDFPDESVYCPLCGQYRQLHLSLQSHLYSKKAQ
jgi:hypothetical protein